MSKPFLAQRLANFFYISRFKVKLLAFKDLVNKEFREVHAVDAGGLPLVSCNEEAVYASQF